LLSVAVNTVDVVPPARQIVGLAATALTVGLSTVTVTVLVAVHPLASVVVMVYVCVLAGVAVGFDTAVELKPVFGLQA
jgi:hypothetical protein